MINSQLLEIIHTAINEELASYGEEGIKEINPTLALTDYGIDSLGVLMVLSSIASKVKVNANCVFDELIQMENIKTVQDIINIVHKYSVPKCDQ